jgi:hypothetical protein
MKFKIYKNLSDNSVDKIVTGIVFYEHTDPGFQWIEINTENHLLHDIEKEMLNTSLKYAVPGKCYHKDIFQSKEEFSDLFNDDEKYEELIRDKWVETRVLRNTLLMTTDWTQLPDAPLTNEQKIKWAEYRQALREIPSGTTNPYVAQWPDLPK